MPTIQQDSVHGAMSRLGFTVFENDVQPHNLNIIGIRKDDALSNHFDDWLIVMWKFHGGWEFLKFRITTDPGKFYSEQPMNPLGTAMLKEGQYRNSHTLGMHQGRYEALVQAGDLTVYRDANRDNVINRVSEQTGNNFGINIHRSRLNGESIQVDKWSAGCQVFANAFEFDQFMSICKSAAGIWGNKFTYTLINLKDIQ